MKSIRILCFSIFALAGARAENAPASSDENFRKIKAFVDAAPRATAKRDLAYAIKISEMDRIWACHKCKELLAIDPKNKSALELYYKLQVGEGPPEVIATYLNNDPSTQKDGQRINEVLSSHLIESVSAGSAGISVDVSSSHADRARFLLAKIILAEKLQISLLKSIEAGKRYVEVKPEEALQSYSASAPSDASFRRIKEFVDAAPKATEKRDSAYAIKISERDRIYACHKCKELLAIDKENSDAQKLLIQLQRGERPGEAIASFPNTELFHRTVGRRIEDVLSSHLIFCTGAGSAGFSVNVDSTLTDRARHLIAKVILNEKLQITFTRSVDGGKRWVEVTPEDAIKDYSE